LNLVIFLSEYLSFNYFLSFLFPEIRLKIIFIFIKGLFYYFIILCLSLFTLIFTPNFLRLLYLRLSVLLLLLLHILLFLLFIIFLFLQFLFSR